MRTKRKWTTDEDELAGVFPNLQRGPGGVPLPPKPTYGGSTPPPTGGGTTTGSPSGSGTGPRKPGSGKPAGAGGASSSSSSSSGASTYQDYINAQKKTERKASNKAANSSIQNAEALRAQANALLRLLGKEPGPGANPFSVGGGKGGKDGKGAGSIRGNVHWVGGTGWKPDGSGPKRPGDDSGVRTGTDVKPMPGQPPKYPSGGGSKPPAVNMPRTAAGRNAANEGVSGGDNTSKDKPGQGGRDKDGGRIKGWMSGDDWKKHIPGQGGKGGGKGGKDKDGGRGGRNLDNDGLAGELKTNLRNVERAMKTADDLLMSQYDERVAELGKAAGDNDKAVNAQGFANQTNRGRERMNAVSELIAQGAGESDALRAQGMSLRNFEQNQLDVNRSFFDTLTTINSSLKDTTIDTRTARVQNKQQAIDDKQQLWNSYFDASSEAYTQLGNTYGQMATEYRNADAEIGGKKGKKAKRRAKRLGDKSADAFMKAADFGSRAKKSTEVADDLMDWEGAKSFQGNLNNSTYRGGAGVAMQRAEGATLRKWDA